MAESLYGKTMVHLGWLNDAGTGHPSIGFRAEMEDMRISTAYFL